MYRRLRLWNSCDREVVLVLIYVQSLETMKQLGPESSLGDYYVFTLVVVYLLW